MEVHNSGVVELCVRARGGMSAPCAHALACTQRPHVEVIKNICNHFDAADTETQSHKTICGGAMCALGGHILLRRGGGTEAWDAFVLTCCFHLMHTRSALVLLYHGSRGQVAPASKRQQRLQFDLMKRSTGVTLHCKQGSSTDHDDSLQVRLHSLRVEAPKNRHGRTYGVLRVPFCHDSRRTRSSMYHKAVKCAT